MRKFNFSIIIFINFDPFIISHIMFISFISLSTVNHSASINKNINNFNFYILLLFDPKFNPEDFRYYSY